MNQLALPLKLQDHAVFESFWSAGNDAAVACLTDLASGGEGPGCWIWGRRSTGKTHLLQSVCERMGDRSVYVPLADFVDAGAGLIDGLGRRDCICLDDVDRVARHGDWERALFALCNQVVDTGGILVVAATSTPRECGFALADLESRFSRLPVFHLQPLADTDRVRALQMRARHRGLDLPDETAVYLLSRSKRDMASLYDALDQLDSAALQAQRRLTIPFVRQALDL